MHQQDAERVITPDDMEPLTAGQTEAEQRRHGWKGEEVRDGSDKPDTEEVPDPSRRKPGAAVNPEA